MKNNRVIEQSTEEEGYVTGRYLRKDIFPEYSSL